MSFLQIVFSAFWLMIPAYVANSSAVVFGGGKPIDLGLKFRDQRLLGDGKTWRGGTGGWILGFVIAQIANIIKEMTALDFSPSFSIIASISLPLGAILGDIGASFLKRRIGYKRGKPVPGLDQLDFVAGAWFLTIILSPVWFVKSFTLPIIITSLVLTPVIHLLANFLGYYIGIKNEPW